MRDQLKDEQYFKNKIIKIKKDIVMYEELINETTSKKGKTNGQLLLVHSYIDIINCLYSYQSNKNEIKPYYEQLLKIYSDIYELEESYTKLIRILSIGILLNIETNKFIQLENKIINKNINDYYLNYLLKYIDPSWNLHSDIFQYSSFYEPLKEVIDKKDIQLLIHYNNVYWYQSHKEAYWYNSHKSKKNTYTGYWNYEGAALAKILKFNVNQFNDLKYFPIDLLK